MKNIADFYFETIKLNITEAKMKSKNKQNKLLNKVEYLILLVYPEG